MEEAGISSRRGDSVCNCTKTTPEGGTKANVIAFSSKIGNISTDSPGYVTRFSKVLHFSLIQACHFDF